MIVPLAFVRLCYNSNLIETASKKKATQIIVGAGEKGIFQAWRLQDGEVVWKSPEQESGTEYKYRNLLFIIN